MLTLGPEITTGFPALSEEKVPYTSTKTDSQEQPAIKGHGNQHENVGDSNLHHM